MKLVIISHTAHEMRGGVAAGFAPTVREIDHLASLFDEVVHVAPLFGEPIPSARPYAAANVRLRPVDPAGGDSLGSKLGILMKVPATLRVMIDELCDADVVHVRCPANIALLAILLLVVRRRTANRWFKYAGSWKAYAGEPWSYRLQRYLLASSLTRGAVTVNGTWPNQAAHIHSFPNPCLMSTEVDDGAAHADKKTLIEPVRLLFVGRVEAQKGVLRAIAIANRLRELGVEATLDIVGDGPERSDLERRASALAGVSFHGWLNREDLPAFFARSHFILLPSTCSEGWPKVLSEAMAYGAVPLASTAGSIRQQLDEMAVGRSFDALDVERFAASVVDYLAHPTRWKDESRRGVKAARRFTYDNYLGEVAHMLGLAPSKNTTLVTSAPLQV